MDTFNFSNCNVTNNFYSKCCDKKLSECRDLLPEEYGIMHNEALEYMVKNYYDDLVNKECTVENLLNDLSRVSEFLTTKYPALKNSIYYETSIARKYIIDLGTDIETGNSKILDVVKYPNCFKTAIEKTVYTEALKNDMILLIKYIHSGEETVYKYKEQLNKIFNSSYSEYDDYVVAIMHSVYNASAAFWGNNKIHSKVAKEDPPSGMTCEEWAIVCDNIGSTMPVPIVNALVAILFSIAALRDCKEDK